MPFAGGAIAATMGVDHGNYGTLPFYRMTEDLVMHNVRGWSSDTQFVAGLKQHQSNPNTGFCGAVFDHIFDSASVVTQDIVDYENELALAVGQGNVPAFLSCSYYESQNEWDNVGKPNPASLSTATTANAIAYETLAKGFPGSYCTDQDNYYLCSGMYVKVNDSANTEYVQVVCPETNGCTTHWSATFRYAHVAGTPISIDWAYQAAQHQLLLYNTLKANSSHPEFAKLVLTTIPFAQATNVAAAESAQESVTGRHLYEVADALNYHFGTCNAPAEESTYVGYQNSIAEALSAYGGSDPFSRRIYVTEATITPPDTFGNGSSSPYVPTTAGGCNAPQMQTAIYASFDPLYLYGMRYFTKLYDPILYDAASGNLSNSYADISGNPKPDYYFRANTLAFVQDDAFDVATLQLPPFTYSQSADTAWCVGYTFTSAKPGNVPTGCTTFHSLWRMQSGEYRMAIRQMPIRGLYPEHTDECTSGGPPNYGQCPGKPPPSPYPTPTAVALTLALPSNITRARVSQQELTCNIPTNIEWDNGGASFSATPSPIFTKAPNTSCGAYTPGPVLTPGSNGTITLTMTVHPAPLIIQLGTGTTPPPIVTPIPMRTWLPIATPGPTGPNGTFPYNQYRTGVYDRVVASP